MTNQIIQDIIELKAKTENNAIALQTNLITFVNNLYAAIHVTVDALQQADNSSSYFMVSDDGAESLLARKLILTVGDFELVFIPLAKPAIDFEAPFGPSFAEQLTTRVLVFSNYAGSQLFYSHWVNTSGEWLGNGLGWMRSGRVDDPEKITDHITTFIRDLFEESKPIWTPISQMILSDEIESNTRTVLGFKTEKKSD